MKYVLSMMALALMTGCAGGQDEGKKQLDALQDELRSLRASNLALQDRVAALEEEGPARADAAASPEASPLHDRPALEVVRVEPDAALEGQPALVSSPPPEAADEERPTIKQSARGAVEVVEDAK